MDIAALSMNMAQSNVMQAVSAKMLSNAMDMADVAGDAITSMIDSSAMELSVNPSVGANFDVMVPFPVFISVLIIRFFQVHQQTSLNNHPRIIR